MEEIIIKQEGIQNDRCRICLEYGEGAICLQSTIKDKTITYWNVLLLICKIKTDIKAPQKICSTCVDKIEALYEFKLLCENSDMILQDELKFNIDIDKIEHIIKFKNEYKIESNFENLETASTENTINIQSDSYHLVDIKSILTETTVEPASQLVHKSTDNEVQTTNCERNVQTFESNVVTTTDDNNCTISEDTIYDNVPSQQSKVNSYNCQLCSDFVCKTTKLFLKHMRKEHGKTEIPRKCDFCDFSNICTHKVGKHMTLCHDDKKILQCTKCDKRFFNKKDMWSHVKGQHEERVPSTCDICGRTFKVHQNLIKHMDIHNGIQNFECKECGKRFTRNTSLFKHQVVHTQERNHKCEKCGATYKSANALKYHNISVHEQLRQYACDACPKKFPRKTQLMQHQVVHTGERRHVCEICGKRFTHAHVLRIHLSKH